MGSVVLLMVRPWLGIPNDISLNVQGVRLTDVLSVGMHVCYGRRYRIRRGQMAGWGSLRFRWNMFRRLGAILMFFSLREISDVSQEQNMPLDQVKEVNVSSGDSRG